MGSAPQSSKLEPPGAGIPRVQKFVARRILLPIAQRRFGWSGVPAELRRQAAELRGLIEREHRRDADRVRERVLIPRLPGLEDDSRCWSLAMSADHLARVNRRIAEVIDSLASNTPLPEGPMEIVDFKPSPDARIDALDRFNATVNLLCDAIASRPEGPPANGASVPHPWFGPLTARQWAAFMPMHQSIHLRQAGHIARRLDR